MKKTILSILATFSVSCTTACKAPTFDNQVRRLWSVQFQTCYCQLYDLNNQTKITDFEECEVFGAKYYPATPVKANALYCEDLVGFTAEKWATHLTPKAKEIRRWAEDECE